LPGFIVALGVLLGCVSARENTARATLTLHATATGQDVVLQVEVADDVAERSRGLMGRDRLAENQGMWFIFPNESLQRVWMKNMRFALDIVFLSTNGCIVAILQQIPPCSIEECPVYQSSAPSQYMLEITAGFVKSHALRVGDCLKTVADKNMTKSAS